MTPLRVNSRMPGSTVILPFLMARTAPSSVCDRRVIGRQSAKTRRCVVAITASAILNGNHAMNGESLCAAILPIRLGRSDGLVPSRRPDASDIRVDQMGAEQELFRILR